MEERSSNRADQAGWTGGIIVGMWLHFFWRVEEMKPGHLKDWGGGGRGWACQCILDAHEMLMCKCAGQ